MFWTTVLPPRRWDWGGTGTGHVQPHPAPAPTQAPKRTQQTDPPVRPWTGTWPGPLPRARMCGDRWRCRTEVHMGVLTGCRHVCQYQQFERCQTSKETAFNWFSVPHVCLQPHLWPPPWLSKYKGACTSQWPAGCLRSLPLGSPGPRTSLTRIYRPCTLVQWFGSADLGALAHLGRESAV